MKRTPLDDLPLFADDAAIGQALLGVRRAAEWAVLVPLYEAKGFPRFDDVMGGRYVPAVRGFFDRQYGLTTAEPKAPGGVERPEAWTIRKRRA